MPNLSDLPNLSDPRSDELPYLGGPSHCAPPVSSIRRGCGGEVGVQVQQLLRNLNEHLSPMRQEIVAIFGYRPQTTIAAVIARWCRLHRNTVRGICAGSPKPRKRHVVRRKRRPPVQANVPCRHHPRAVKPKACIATPSAADLIPICRPTAKEAISTKEDIDTTCARSPTDNRSNGNPPAHACNPALAMWTACTQADPHPYKGIGSVPAPQRELAIGRRLGDCVWCPRTRRWLLHARTDEFRTMRNISDPLIHFCRTMQNNATSIIIALIP